MMTVESNEEATHAARSGPRPDDARRWFKSFRSKTTESKTKERRLDSLRSLLKEARDSLPDLDAARKALVEELLSRLDGLDPDEAPQLDACVQALLNPRECPTEDDWVLRQLAIESEDANEQRSEVANGVGIRALEARELLRGARRLRSEKAILQRALDLREAERVAARLVAAFDSNRDTAQDPECWLRLSTSEDLARLADGRGKPSVSGDEILTLLRTRTSWERHALARLHSIANARAAGLGEFVAGSPLLAPSTAVAVLSFLGLVGVYFYYLPLGLPILDYASTTDLLRWGITYSPISILSLVLVTLGYQWLFRGARGRLRMSLADLSREIGEPGKSGGESQELGTLDGFLFRSDATHLSVAGLTIATILVALSAAGASLIRHPVDLTFERDVEISDVDFVGTTAGAAVYRNPDGGYFLLDRSKVLCQSKDGPGASKCEALVKTESPNLLANLEGVERQIELQRHAIDFLVAQQLSRDPLTLKEYIENVLACRPAEKLGQGVPLLYFPHDSDEPCGVDRACAAGSDGKTKWKKRIAEWVDSWDDNTEPPKIWVLGMASTDGSAIYNYSLADRRADRVVRWIRDVVATRFGRRVDALVQARSIGEDVVVGSAGDPAQDRHARIFVCE